VEISIAVPAYEEIAALPELYRRVEQTMSELGASWELVISDDDSRDGSREYLRGLTARDRRVRAVLLSRNFGHANNHLAALAHSSGE
jgi:glycosyltransferase involved in cell wall biosynthesis